MLLQSKYEGRADAPARYPLRTYLLYCKTDGRSSNHSSSGVPRTAELGDSSQLHPAGHSCSSGIGRCSVIPHSATLWVGTTPTASRSSDGELPIASTARNRCKGAHHVPRRQLPMLLLVMLGANNGRAAQYLRPKRRYPPMRSPSAPSWATMPQPQRTATRVAARSAPTSRPPATTNGLIYRSWSGGRPRGPAPTSPRSAIVLAM